MTRRYEEIQDYEDAEPENPDPIGPSRGCLIGLVLFLVGSAFVGILYRIGERLF